MFIRPNGAVTGSILVADLPPDKPKTRRGRPTKEEAAAKAAATPEPGEPAPVHHQVAVEPQPEPEQPQEATT